MRCWCESHSFVQSWTTKVNNFVLGRGLCNGSLKVNSAIGFILRTWKYIEKQTSEVFPTTFWVLPIFLRVSAKSYTPSPGPGAGQNLASSASAVTQTNISRKLLFSHCFLGLPSFHFVPHNFQVPELPFVERFDTFWVTKGPRDEIDLIFWDHGLLKHEFEFRIRLSKVRYIKKHTSEGSCQFFEVKNPKSIFREIHLLNLLHLACGYYFNGYLLIPRYLDGWKKTPKLFCHVWLSLHLAFFFITIWHLSYILQISTFNCCLLTLWTWLFMSAAFMQLAF